MWYCQKTDKYRSVEQIRDPQIDRHNCGWQKRAKAIQLNQEQSFQQIVLKQQDIYM